MSKKVPYKADYDIVETIESISLSILWFSVAISVLTLIVLKFGTFSSNEVIVPYLNTTNSFLSVIYFISDIVSNYLFQIAEAKRREDFFDNSLNTQLAELTL